MTSIASTTLAWLLTYALHSTALLGLAWLITRRTGTTASARDLIWKTALVGGILTATAQRALDVRPAGSLSLGSHTATTESIRHPQGDGAAAPHAAESATVPPADVDAAVQSQTTANASGTPRFSGVTAGAVAVAAWAVVGFFLALVFAARRLILVGRLGDRRAVLDGPLPAMLESLRLESGHRHDVRVTSSSTISSPVALKLGEICVPEAALTELDAEQQRGLLAHELAHLARRDPLWLDAVGIIERVFFFQPLNRLARRELQQVAEYLCDDWAAARTGGGLPLAQCLARVAEWIQASPLGVPVAGMAEQRSLLVARIARLIEGGSPPVPARRGALLAASAILLAATVAAAPGVQSTAAALANEPSNIGTIPMPSVEPESQQAQDTTVIKALIERLKDTDAGVRRAAASSLGNLRAQRAVPALIAAIGDKDREVRQAIAEALGELEDERAVAALTQLIADPFVDVRATALGALEHFARQVPVASVVAALQDAHPEVRARAASLLGEARQISAVGPLTKLLDDSSAEVREHALSALVEIRDPSAASSITRLLKDPRPNVRARALDALRELRAPIAERALLDALADESADVRQNAAQAVSDRPFAAAVPRLLAMIDDPSSDVRTTAVEALGAIGTAPARDALRAALNSKDARVRKAAIEALGNRP